MPTTVQDVFQRVQTILIDQSAHHWPLPELLNWLNDGIREIANLKPNSTAETVEIELAEGTLQTLDVTHTQLIRVIRNIATSKTDPGGQVSGPAITVVSGDVLDAQVPGWHSDAVIPFSNTVKHVVDDMADTGTFYVVPGNDGTGIIEAVVAIIPEPLPAPDNPTMLEQYTDEVPIKPAYINALTDYILYRCFSKDSRLPGSANLSNKHYQMFAHSLGQKFTGEMAANVNKNSQGAA